MVVGPQASGAERALSKVVGIALLLVIVLLLAITTSGVLIGLFSTTEPATVAPATFEERTFGVRIELQGHVGDADRLEVQLNGERAATLEDYGTASTRTVECVSPGDEIALISVTGEDSHVIQRHEVRTRTACRFEVSQPGDESVTVAPVNWQSHSQDVQELYSYGGRDGTGHPHAHMAPSSPYVDWDTSYVFFYEMEGTTSLVFVHDAPEHHCSHQGEDHSDLDHIDGSCYGESGDGTVGGAATFAFDGLPADGHWEIQDDASDYNFSESSVDRTPGPPFDPDQVPWADQACPEDQVCWSWNQKHTDGGVYAGGFRSAEEVAITISADWGSDAIGDGHWNDDHQVDEWAFLYRQNGQIKQKSLDMDEDLTITEID